MKSLLILLLLSLTIQAQAEVETGVIFLRLETEEEIEPRIREIIYLVKKGKYRGPHFKCGSSRGRVYGVDVPGLRYKTDRNGNIESYHSVNIKYRCRR